MSGKRKRYDEEFKKNAVKLSYASVKTIREIASDLDVGEAVLYRLNIASELSHLCGEMSHQMRWEEPQSA